MPRWGMMIVLIALIFIVAFNVPREVSIPINIALGWVAGSLAARSLTEEV